jgi:lipoprotein NlpD
MLIRIALENGQNWRDVQRWNGMDNPNLVEVGQVLRVAPPVTEGAAVTRPVAAAGRVDATPLDARAPGAPVAAVTAGSAAVTSRAGPMQRRVPPLRLRCRRRQTGVTARR